MLNDKPDGREMRLVDFEQDALEQSAAFELLSEVSAERVWLANFASENTRQAYQRAVGSFIATVGFTSPDDLYSVKQAHVLAWRTAMERAAECTALAVARSRVVRIRTGSTAREAQRRLKDESLLLSW
ncbi:MAG: hypothetical protein AAF636_23990 [Pseudomonadota bacterium]